MSWRPEFRAVAAETPVAISPATSTRAVGPRPGEAAPWTPPSAAPLASTRGSSMLCSSPRPASVRCHVPEPAKHAADPLSPRLTHDQTSWSSLLATTVRLWDQFPETQKSFALLPIFFPQSSETASECDDLFDYVGSSSSWTRSSFKRDLSCRFR